MTTTRIPFTLRGADGTITVDYSVNEDPGRWGYPLLWLPYDLELARGCPVLHATVEHPGEGYAAALGWIQIVHLATPDLDEVIVDAAPQMAAASIPWVYWGTRPTFFDAPSTARREVRWRAHTFLAYTPDAVMSRQVSPVSGFSWGYDVKHGHASIAPLRVDGLTHWSAARQALAQKCPGWKFEDR
jgi:hypothetical protein